MKKYDSLIIFIIFSFILIINCEKDCSQCEVSESSSPELKCSNCDNDCMWFQIDSTNTKCLGCDDINTSESKYYSKGIRLTGEPYCHKIGISGFKNKKIIYKTKQIVENCKDLDLYQMGDVCYHSNPDTKNIVVDESQKILKCKFYNYKEIKDGLIYYKCLEENERCPDELNYFDGDTNECFNSCQDKIAIINEVVNSENKIFYRCTYECSGEYDKELIKKSALGEEIAYCYKNCPEEAKFFYDSEKKCIENCDSSQNHFFNDNNKCTNNINDCGNSFYFLINSKINYYSCKSEELSSCPEDYPYKYTASDGKNYCLSSCDDTNIAFLGRIKTYLYIEQKICTNIRPSNDQSPDTRYYIDEKGKKWVTDCSLANSGPFHDGEKCVDNCGNKFIVEDTNECVESCDTTNNYYIDIDNDIKTCVKECHSYLGRGFYNSNKECVKCGINGVGSGFHKIDGRECYSECQTDNEFKYHNYNNNICFNTECKNNPDYKYTSSDNQYICYNSCSDIAGGYIYEINFVCYKDEPTLEQVNDISDYYFYQNINNIYKYLKIKDGGNINEEELLKLLHICFSLGLRYLRNSKFVQDCESTEYRVYPKSNKFGLCFSDSSKCIEAGYEYYNNSRICSDECNNALSVKDRDISDSSYSLVLTTDNCLKECPGEYPFQNGNECLKQCPDGFYYIESGSNKICQENCNNYIINEDNGKKKCSKQCIRNNNDIPTFNYYYTNSDLKICTDSCKTLETEFKFSLEATNEHKECKNQCPDDAPYYYDNEKICLKKCDNYYDGNKCIDSWSSFVYMENQCRNSCPEDVPFYIVKSVNDNTIKECVASCVENNNQYFIPVGENQYECRNIVDSGKVIFNGKIVDSCPGGLELNSNSICEIPSGWSHFKISENTASSAEESDCIGKYITTSLECVDICPFGEHFISTDGIHCQSSCNGLYYKKKIIDSGISIDYILYECIEESEPICLHIDGKKQCLENNDCGNLYKDVNVCRKNCGAKFSKFTNELKHVCIDEECNYYDNDKMCDDDCSFSSTKIWDDNKGKCVEECDQSTDYKFLTLIDNKLHCSRNCDNSEYKRYFTTDYKCIPKCPSNTYVDENTGECLSDCSKKIELQDGEYICLTQCSGDKYYYENSQLCLPDCYPGDYNIDGTKICAKSCSSSQYYYEYDSTITLTNNGDIIPNKDKCVSSCSSTSKPFTRENNHCDVSCDSDISGDYYYNDEDKICKRHCDTNEKTNGKFCVPSCQSIENPELNKYEDENKNCLDSCSDSITGYIYNEERSFDCINECPSTKFIDNNLCLASCPETENSNIYKYNNLCVPNCPKDKRYFVSSGESKNKCLDDCPEEYPYFSITKIQNPDVYLFECKNTCGAYVPNEDPDKNALLCLGNACNGAYQYFLEKNINGKDIKECYPQCPNLYYSEERDENKVNLQCYRDCKTQDLYYFENYYK